MSDNHQLIKRISEVEIGPTTDEVVCSLEYVLEIYSQTRDRAIREVIRSKVSDLVDFIIEHDLAGDVDIAKFMLYD